jgi:hypothetical protein
MRFIAELVLVALSGFLIPLGFFLWARWEQRRG